MLTTLDTTRHPCFNKEVAGQCGRVHLPVAPKCNIRCNYCNRKYDCVNESRPGVSSAVLKPLQAVAYMEKVLEKEPRITVVGIAGPGDPMANAGETLSTIRLVRQRFPQLLFCLSSNGLALPAHMDEIAEAGVSHVTVTMNAVDPRVGAEVYGWVKEGNVLYQGEQAAEVLMNRQLESIKGMKERGVIVKVNTIVIPGVNDHHIEAVAKKAASLGADILNLIPLSPCENTPFEKMEEPSKAMINELRAKAGEIIPQMTHCQRCRADAVGLLCKDRSGEMADTLKACSRQAPTAKERPFVAVASREGMLVNLHLGEAESLQIWEKTDTGYTLREERRMPEPGTGPMRWARMAEILADCRAVLAGAMGEQPRKILRESGVIPHECSGLIEDALAAVYGEGDLAILKGRRRGIGGSCCSGAGKGCS